MLAQELISESIIPLKTSDSGNTALTWMDEFRVSHLPIVNNIEFLGLISEADIYNLNSPEEPLGNHTLSLKRPFVYYNQHFFEIIKAVYEDNLTIIPVLDASNNYLGVITLNKLIQSFATSTSVNNVGGIIVLEVNINDYSAAEITQIIEYNDAKVLSLYIANHQDSTKMEVVIKINKIDITPIIQTFIRYNYIVKASITENDNNDDLKDRFDSFMNFLNM